jgi:glycopeptide antibiotics resistance protein
MTNMRNRLIPAILAIAYAALLIRLMVFKTLLLRIGPLRFRTSPETGEANLQPLKSILPYLRGEPNGLIAFANLAGNIALLVPIGFLAPFIFQGMTWGRALVLAVASGLAIEGLEVAFRTGIFDIDDLILNALGVLIGHGIFLIAHRRRGLPTSPALL